MLAAIFYNGFIRTYSFKESRYKGTHESVWIKEGETTFYTGIYRNDAGKITSIRRHTFKGNSLKEEREVTFK